MLTVQPGSPGRPALWLGFAPSPNPVGIDHVADKDCIVSGHKWSFFPISLSDSKNTPRNIGNMPAVIFIALLDLGKKPSFVDRHYNFRIALVTVRIKWHSGEASKKRPYPNDGPWATGRFIQQLSIVGVFLGPGRQKLPYWFGTCYIIRNVEREWSVMDGTWPGRARIPSRIDRVVIEV